VAAGAWVAAGALVATGASVAAGAWVAVLPDEQAARSMPADMASARALGSDRVVIGKDVLEWGEGWCGGGEVVVS
jgi:hypothetical protein